MSLTIRRRIEALEAKLRHGKEATPQALDPIEVVHAALIPYLVSLRPNAPSAALEALAARIRGGSTNADDEAALQALPAKALGTLDLTASGYVLWVQDVLDRF